MDDKVIFVQECKKKIKVINKIIVCVYFTIVLYFFFFYYIPKGLIYATYAKTNRSRGGGLIGVFIYQYIFAKCIRFFLEVFEEYSWIYSDKIELRSNVAIKNIVYFKDLKQIKEVKLITGKTIYIFDDGRKDGPFNISKLSVFYRLKYNLRIEKTEELERFIEMNLKDKLIHNDEVGTGSLG